MNPSPAPSSTTVNRVLLQGSEPIPPIPILPNPPGLDRKPHPTANRGRGMKTRPLAARQRGRHPLALPHRQPSLDSVQRSILHSAAPNNHGLRISHPSPPQALGESGAVGTRAVSGEGFHR